MVRKSARRPRPIRACRTHRALLALAVALAAGGAGGCGDPPEGGAPAADAGPPPAQPPLPEGFLFGTATAPYQIEGGLTATDWAQWEAAGRIANDDRADDGPRSFARHAADVELGAALGTNAYRFGIDWSRLFPTPESFPDGPDPTAVAHYHDLLAAVRAAGMVPMVTIFHFVLPVWVHDLDDLATRGGWLTPSTVDRFEQLAAFLGAEYGAEVDLWVPLNEPQAYLLAGYLVGAFPPGHLAAFGEARAAARALIDAHARAYDALHAADLVDADGDGAPALVGVATHNRVFEPLAPGTDDERAAARVRYVNNRLFLEATVFGDYDDDWDERLDGAADRVADPALAGHLDWIGLNYYGRAQVQFISDAFPLLGLPSIDHLATPTAKSDFGQDLFPEGFRVVLDELGRYGLPLYVTENGIADADDDQRPRFLAEHLYELQRAVAEGVDLRGYFYWSLLDNFEWSAGFCPRFGLYHVDYGDADRPRVEGEGARAYRQIIAARGVDPSLLLTLPPFPAPGLDCRTGP